MVYVIEGRPRLIIRERAVIEMNYDTNEALKPYYNIRMMLEHIPRELWNAFLPASEKGLAELETRILALKAREAERDQAMSIQRLCGLPFRPNERLRDVKAKARVQGIKKEHLRRRRNNDGFDEA